MPYTAAQTIELFHLAFLGVLRTRVDESRYVLKGGANLRYFFDSVRYSEDIDLDIYGLEANWRFEEQVDTVLRSDTLGRLLRASQVTLEPEDITKPKQTPTTRRWRAFLSAAGHADKIRTKIEFSARNGDTRFQLDPVPTQIVAPYAIRPPSMQHYLLAPAIEQKVLALAQRPETQARDVFDLDLLLRQGDLAKGAVDEQTRKNAAEAAVSLTWSDFETMIVPFLEPTMVDHHGPSDWEAMQDFVAGELLK
jgi:hypothetical protein